MPERVRGGAFARMIAALLVLPWIAMACAPAGEWAPDAVVAQARHAHDGPPEIVLITVVNTRSNAGDHSALFINADQRVLYDPAGSWFNRHAPRRNDVHYGFTPLIESYYLDYHARDTHHVIAQRLRVTPAQAAAALRAAEAQSAAGSGQCAVRTSAVLREVPGLDGLRGSVFPRSLMNSFGTLPGVVSERIDGPVPPPRGVPASPAPAPLTLAAAAG